MTGKLPPFGVALAVLRSVLGWPQKDLAAAVGCGPTLISDYETGRKVLSRKRFEKILAVLGLPPAAGDRALVLVREVLSLAAPEGGAVDGSPHAEAAIAEVAARAEAFARSMLSLGAVRQAEAERRRAPALWQRLKGHSPSLRLTLVKGTQEFRSWALCEAVCELSLKAAADRADRALELARFAQRIAELASGTEGWRRRLQGYALAHVANALRVGGQLPAADETLARALSLWRAGAEEAPALLSEARLLSLEASLRLDQRRLPEALELIDRALPLAPEGERKKILLKRADVLSLAGDFEAAIATFQEAAVLVSRESEPRMFFGLQFNLADNLLQAGRPEEAEALLPELRKLTVRLDNDLDRLRLRWLEGRMAAGLGRAEEALVALARVREELTTRQIASDVALVTLEIAVLYLVAGRTSEVRTLARRLVWVFDDHGIHREALAALRLFCEAAERERVSLDLARRIATFLRRAQGNPSLRFEDDRGPLFPEAAGERGPES